MIKKKQGSKGSVEDVEILCRESGEEGALREAGENHVGISRAVVLRPELAPKETCGNFWPRFWLLTFWLGGTQASSALRPGVMPNILRYMEPPQQRITWSKMSVVFAVEKTLL